MLRAAPVLVATQGRVKLGDVWQLGRHRLLCGDSSDANQVARLMQDERARLTITSPPYNLGHSASLAANVTLRGSRYVHGDSRGREEYVALLTGVTLNALAVSDIVVVDVQMLAGNKVALLEWLYGCREQVIDVAIWDKGNAAPAMAKNVLNSRFEFLIFLTNRRSKGATPRTIFTADFRGTVSNVYARSGQKRNPYFHVHAATFPIHLPLWIMQTFDSDKRAGVVFDPFLGTGTTLLAAEQLGRVCYGMEIEPSYCDIVIQRWEQATGKRAEEL